MKKILVGFLMFISFASFLPAPAYADDKNCVNTSVLGNGSQYCEDEDGGGVYHILNIALQILTYGVGILAVLGFVIVGTQYILARDNEAQVAKAKERLMQIVIGLVVYALLYIGLNFLIPGGVFG